MANFVKKTVWFKFVPFPYEIWAENKGKLPVSTTHSSTEERANQHYYEMFPNRLVSNCNWTKIDWEYFEESLQLAEKHIEVRKIDENQIDTHMKKKIVFTFLTAWGCGNFFRKAWCWKLETIQSRWDDKQFHLLNNFENDISNDVLFLFDSEFDPEALRSFRCSFSDLQTALIQGIFLVLQFRESLLSFKTTNSWKNWNVYTLRTKRSQNICFMFR